VLVVKSDKKGPLNRVATMYGSQMQRSLSSSSSSSSGEDFRDMSIGWASSEEKISIYFVIFLPLLALVLILAKFLHDKPALSAVLPEAGMTILVGMIAGALLYLIKPEISTGHYDSFYDYADDAVDDAAGDVDDDGAATEVQEVATGLLSFSATFFFAALLPPIIFNSGYHVNRSKFEFALYLNQGRCKTQFRS
jgi:hypothetical protein